MIFDFRFMKEKVSVGIIGIVTFVILVNLACVTARPAQPHTKIETWAGDSKSGSVLRGQDRQQIECKSPQFDQMVCMKYDDLQKLHFLMGKCDSWEK